MSSTDLLLYLLIGAWLIVTIMVGIIAYIWGMDHGRKIGKTEMMPLREELDSFITNVERTRGDADTYLPLPGDTFKNMFSIEKIYDKDDTEAMIVGAMLFTKTINKESEA